MTNALVMTIHHMSNPIVDTLDDCAHIFHKACVWTPRIDVLSQGVLEISRTGGHVVNCVPNQSNLVPCGVHHVEDPPSLCLSQYCSILRIQIENKEMQRGLARLKDISLGKADLKPFPDVFLTRRLLSIQIRHIDHGPAARTGIEILKPCFRALQAERVIALRFHWLVEVFVTDGAYLWRERGEEGGPRWQTRGHCERGWRWSSRCFGCCCLERSRVWKNNIDSGVDASLEVKWESGAYPAGVVGRELEVWCVR